MFRPSPDRRAKSKTIFFNFRRKKPGMFSNIRLPTPIQKTQRIYKIQHLFGCECRPKWSAKVKAEVQHFLQSNVFNRATEEGSKYFRPCIYVTEQGNAFTPENIFAKQTKLKSANCILINERTCLSAVGPLSRFRASPGSRVQNTLRRINEKCT